MQAILTMPKQKLRAYYKAYCRNNVLFKTSLGLFFYKVIYYKNRACLNLRPYYVYFKTVVKVIV